MRTCKTCKIPQPIESFEEIRGKYRRRVCNECTKAYRRDHHDSNTDKGRSIQGAETKLFRIGKKGTLIATPDLIKQVEDEIAKCDLICSNCHRIRTKERHDG